MLLFSVFHSQLFMPVNAVLIPLGELSLDEFARKFPTNTTEIRAVFPAALEDRAAVLPHLDAFSVVFAAALAAAVVEKTALLAIAAAGGDF